MKTINTNSVYWVFEPSSDDADYGILSDLVSDYYSEFHALTKRVECSGWVDTITAESLHPSYFVTINGHKLRLIDPEAILGPNIALPLGSGVIPTQKNGMLAILFILGLKKHLPASLANALSLAGDDDCEIAVSNDDDLLRFLSLFSDLNIDDFDDIHAYRPLFEHFGILAVKRSFLSMIEESDDLLDDWI